MTGRADRWIRCTTTGCITILALIAGAVSYLHMHALVTLHGQPGWVAVLTPFSVDGMIVATSTTLLSESRSGSRGGVLPWVLLVIGSVASLAANVAVAEPTVVGRVIAAWPSFALIGSYELLMRQVRRIAAGRAQPVGRPSARPLLQQTPVRSAGLETPPRLDRSQEAVVKSVASAPGLDGRRQAWQWAVANKAPDGSLPSGKAIADRYGRHERWGRLVKAAGNAGEFADARLSGSLGTSVLSGQVIAHRHGRPERSGRRSRTGRNAPSS